MTQWCIRGAAVLSLAVIAAISLGRLIGITVASQVSGVLPGFIVSALAHFESQPWGTIGAVAAGLAFAYLLAAPPGWRRARPLQQINRLGWREFEYLAAAHLRRLGYRVRLHGGSGGDDGIDLVATRRGRRYIVQCKHWKGRRVGVAIVREMFGVMHAQGADGVVIVTSGTFTSAAWAFGRANRITLVNGPALAQSLSGAHPLSLIQRQPAG